jgi:hypothetical protein
MSIYFVLGLETGRHAIFKHFLWVWYWVEWWWFYKGEAKWGEGSILAFPLKAWYIHRQSVTN